MMQRVIIGTEYSMMLNSNPPNGVIYPFLTLMIKSNILQYSVTDKENAI